MPPSRFDEYVQEVQNLITSLIAAGEVSSFSLHVDRRSSVQGFIGGRVQFRDGSELHFREFVNLALDEPRLMFAYHYQGPDKRLIFRYDNALHRPPLPKREHKHTPSGVEIAPAPKLREILDEILQAMKRDRSL